MPDQSNAMRELRLRMLTTPPAEFGIKPSTEFPRVYGIVMDWPIGEEIATVVAMCDGNASLYSTSTFGVIGGGGHESVRSQATAFVRKAVDFTDNGSPTTEFPYPQRDRVRFYLLTFDGVRVIDADMRSVGGGQDKLAELFAQGQEVLTELRLITEKTTGGNGPNNSARKEGSGEAGYVNCLVGAMSSGIVRSVEIAASEAVPDLIELTAGNTGLQQWIAARGFSFEDLDARQVIREIRQSARITGLPFLSRCKALPTFHALEDGTVVARMMDVCIGPFNRNATIELAADDDPRVIALQRQADAR